VVILQRGDDAGLLGIASGPLQALHCALPYRLTPFALLDVAREEANHRRPQELRRIDPLPDLLLHRILVGGWPAKVIADADAGDAQPALQAQLLYFLEMIAVQRAQRADVEIDAIELQLGTQVDELEVIELLGGELGFETK